MWMRTRLGKTINVCTIMENQYTSLIILLNINMCHTPFNFCLLCQIPPTSSVVSCIVHFCYVTKAFPKIFF